MSRQLDFILSVNVDLISSPWKLEWHTLTEIMSGLNVVNNSSRVFFDLVHKRLVTSFIKIYNCNFNGCSPRRSNEIQDGNTCDPFSETCSENLHREAFRRKPNQIPEAPQLVSVSVEEQQLYSEHFLDDGASHLSVFAL